MATPVLQALLLADHIYQDRTTGKQIICGVFGTLYFTPADEVSQPESGEDVQNNDNKESPEPADKGVPVNRLMRVGSPYAYINLTEVQGVKKFELRYVELFENTAMFSTEFQVKSQDPLATIEISVPLPPLPAPREGSFALELLCDNELLGAHRVSVKRNPHIK